MKTKTILLLFFIGLVLASSCQKEEEEEEPQSKNLDGKASGAIINSRLVNVSDKTLECKLGVLLVNDKGDFVTGLKSANFSIEGLSGVEFEVSSVSYSEMTPDGPYSAGILLDQSGSIEDTDPDNMRIEAAKCFVRFMKDNDEVLLSSFQNNSYQILKDFTTDSTAIFADLDCLIGHEWGSTPLYSSAYNVTDYIDISAGNSNQALLLFTDGEDNNSIHDIADVVQNSKDKNIPVYTIGLSENVDVAVLAEIANQTGGAFMWAEDVKQLITLFGNLGDLLHGTATYYNIVVKAVKDNVNWGSSEYFYTVLNVTLSDGQVVEVPFRVNAY